MFSLIPKFTNQNLSRISHFLLLFCILILSVVCNPLISGWNVEPSVYFFFEGSILFASFFYINYLNKKIIQLNFIDGLLLICFLCCVITAMMTFQQSFFINDSLLTYMAVLSLYLPMKEIYKRNVHDLYFVFTLIVLFEIGTGILQLASSLYYLHTAPTLTGTFRNSGIYAIFLAFSLPLLFLLLKEQRLRVICIYLVLVVLALIIISKSRTAILLSMVIIGLQYSSNKKHIFYKWIKYVVVIFILMFVALIYFKYNSLIGRVFIWRNTISLFLEKPLTGWGGGSFEKQYLLAQLDYFRKSDQNVQYRYVAGNVTTAFNEYLQLLLEFGLLGVALFIYVIYNIIRIVRRTDNERVLYAGFSLGLIGISAFFYYSLHVTVFLCLIIISLAVIAVETGTSKSIKIKNAGLKLIIMVGSPAFVLYCIGQYNATNNWKHAAVIAQHDKPAALKIYKDIYLRLEHRSNFLYNYGAALFDAGQYTSSISIFEKGEKMVPDVDQLIFLGRAYQYEGNFDEAIRCFTDASDMVPSRFYPPFFLAMLYLQNGQKGKAIVIANKILHMPIKVPSPDVDFIREKMNTLITQ